MFRFLQIDPNCETLFQDARSIILHQDHRSHESPEEGKNSQDILLRQHLTGWIASICKSSPPRNKQKRNQLLQVCSRSPNNLWMFLDCKMFKDRKDDAISLVASTSCTPLYNSKLFKVITALILVVFVFFLDFFSLCDRLKICNDICFLEHTHTHVEGLEFGAGRHLLLESFCVFGSQQNTWRLLVKNNRQGRSWRLFPFQAELINQLLKVSFLPTHFAATRRFSCQRGGLSDIQLPLIRVLPHCKCFGFSCSFYCCCCSGFWCFRPFVTSLPLCLAIFHFKAGEECQFLGLEYLDKIKAWEIAQSLA
jgi:hypothetical protein